jgi:hypothetical protein
MIEVDLKTKTGVVTVQRLFKAGANTSEWKINGALI